MATSPALLGLNRIVRSALNLTTNFPKATGLSLNGLVLWTEPLTLRELRSDLVELPI